MYLYHSSGKGGSLCSHYLCRTPEHAKLTNFKCEKRSESEGINELWIALQLLFRDALCCCVEETKVSGKLLRTGMVWRFLMRYLANNEHLIDRLAQSNLMRRAAQMTVYFSLKWKEFGYGRLENLKNSSGAKILDPQTLQRFAKKFTAEIKDGVNEFKKSKPS